MVGHCRYSAVAVGHCVDTLRWALVVWALQDTLRLRLGIAWILCGWALQGYSAVAVGHCVDTLQWALQGYSGVGHCRDTLRLGTAGILCGCGWPLRGYSAVGTAGILCGCALQGYVTIEHCGRAQHRHSKSNNPTTRVGKQEALQPRAHGPS